MKYMHNLDTVHGNVGVVRPFTFSHYRSVLTLLKRNVLVDGDGVPRLGGLGSAFTLSLPASWSDVEAERLPRGIAPELINPQAFGLMHARTTKATDMFAFGMLAWEVNRSFMCFNLEVFTRRCRS